MSTPHASAADKCTAFFALHASGCFVIPIENGFDDDPAVALRLHETCGAGDAAACDELLRHVEPATRT